MSVGEPLGASVRPLWTSAELMRDALDASRERMRERLQLARPLDVRFAHNEHALPPLPPPRDDDSDGASHVSSRLACRAACRSDLAAFQR